MTVLIAKQNEPIIKSYLPKASFIESTKNTSTFNITPKSFERLVYKVKIAGYNPYSLMSW